MKSQRRVGLILVAALIGTCSGREHESVSATDSMEVPDFGSIDNPPMDKKPSRPPPIEMPEVKTVPYTKPIAAGLHWVELFESLDNWVTAQSEKFTGEWGLSLRKKEAIVGDYGLLVPEPNKFYGITTKIPPVNNKDGKEITVSYEVDFQDPLICSGGYMKLFDSTGVDLSTWNNTIPYAIMFGPDKCGSTDKIHLIIQQRNPITGNLVEHHLKNTPHIYYGGGGHAYTLRLMPDDTYDILVDAVSKQKGKLSEDFEPPFTPPKEIDDPTDIKPTDWVDDAKMVDPTAVKPDDWNEDEPLYIVDPDDKMPAEWLENEPGTIPDTIATKPDTWKEEDGEWESPIVPNPKCTVGCGPWSPKKKVNPDYKGKWLPPRIDNPQYKGEWVPRQIPNPDYFVNEHPHILYSQIDAIGFDIWVTDKNILFDNVVVSRDFESVLDFLKETFMVRSKIQDAWSMRQAAARGGRFADQAWRHLVEFAMARPFVSVPIAVILVAILAVIAPSLAKIVIPVRGAAKVGTEKKDTASTVGAEGGSQGTTDDSAAAEDAATTSPTSKQARKRGGRPAPLD